MADKSTGAGKGGAGDTEREHQWIEVRAPLSATIIGTSINTSAQARVVAYEDT